MSDKITMEQLMLLTAQRIAGEYQTNMESASMAVLSANICRLTQKCENLGLLGLLENIDDNLMSISDGISEISQTLEEVKKRGAFKILGVVDTYEQN